MNRNISEPGVPRLFTEADYVACLHELVVADEEMDAILKERAEAMGAYENWRQENKELLKWASEAPPEFVGFHQAWANEYQRIQQADTFDKISLHLDRLKELLAGFVPLIQTAQKMQEDASAVPPEFAGFHQAWANEYQRIQQADTFDKIGLHLGRLKELLAGFVPVIEEAQKIQRSANEVPPEFTGFHKAWENEYQCIYQVDTFDKIGLHFGRLKEMLDNFVPLIQEAQRMQGEASEVPPEFVGFRQAWADENQFIHQAATCDEFRMHVGKLEELLKVLPLIKNMSANADTMQAYCSNSSYSFLQRFPSKYASMVKTSKSAADIRHLSECTSNIFYAQRDLDDIYNFLHKLKWDGEENGCPESSYSIDESYVLSTLQDAAFDLKQWRDAAYLLRNQLYRKKAKIEEEGDLRSKAFGDAEKIIYSINFFEELPWLIMILLFIPMIIISFCILLPAFGSSVLLAHFKYKRLIVKAINCPLSKY